MFKLFGRKAFLYIILSGVSILIDTAFILILLFTENETALFIVLVLQNLMTLLVCLLAVYYFPVDIAKNVFLKQNKNIFPQLITMVTAGAYIFWTVVGLPIALNMPGDSKL